MDNVPSNLCECGSGLRGVRCCRFKRDESVADASPALLAKVARAVEAWSLGDDATAEALALEALDAAPERPRALRLLAELREKQGKVTAAAALLHRLVALEPMNFWAINKLALLELGRGQTGPAEALARGAVRIAPDNPQAHNLMAMVMTEQRRAVVGEYHCRRALELSGQRIPLVLANLATNLMNQGRLEEARALYAESDELAPHVRPTLMAWARLEEADRKLDAAHALLDRVAALKPNNPAVTLTRAAVLGREGKYAEAVDLLDAAAQGRSRPLRPVERLERGRLLDRMGRHDEAWSDWAAGKAQALEMTGNGYRQDVAADMARRLKQLFTRGRLATLPRGGVRTDIAQPIFILGFPRSGTTLLEQTLSAAPDISAGDELPLIHMLVGLLPRMFDSPLGYPEALAELWMGDQREGLDNLRDLYLQKARQMGAVRDGARWFTDKMPLNEVHMGLISLVFPQAPLVHVIRHPLDIMVSAMSNFFTHGNFCSSALESAATHLLLSAELVAHYRREMDLRYLAVRYEDIVDDQEATVRRVFEFVGAPFDPASLRFERNARYARTASYAQVTEKLYDRSRYRYRHYREGLQPVLPILQPLIDRLGYTVEDRL